MAQSFSSDENLAKSENEGSGSVWSEEDDRIPLKQRLKVLLSNSYLSDLGDSNIGEDGRSVSIPPIDIVVKKEEEQCISLGFHSACFVEEGSIERLALQQSHAEKFGASDGTLLQHSVLSKYAVKEKVGNTDNRETSLENCLNGTSGANVRAIRIKTEIPDDFLDDLDHVVLKERQRMLLSRKSLGVTKPILEGNLSGLSSTVLVDMIQHDAGIGKEESHSGVNESSMEGNHSCEIPHANVSVFCKTLESSSSNYMIAGSSGTIPQCPVLACPCQGTKSSDFLNIHENDRICFSMKTSTEYESCDGKDLLAFNHNTILSSTLSNFVNIKVESLDNKELQSPDKDAVGNSCFANIVPVKNELEIADKSLGDEVDHMLLRERMKLFATREVPTSDVYGNFECSRKKLPSASDCRPIVSESSKPRIIKHRPKRRKTATDSVETALEEDAPGLLQVLIDKGVLVNEIKLYGEMESDEALDDSLTEDSFTELEAVISKLFFQRHSLLKFAPLRCTKGEKASYYLACLISLVEQARYLQFRKWPVEWGWCRDLQSFIFVFERHNRIVLERPEYGYATYFFELVDSLPIDWQIKRLVTAMKLTSCSRVTLIENKTLMVGEDLTEGEAGVLMEYGWTPNSGLGTMLNYCDRVVHDRKNDRDSSGDSSEWRSKIGKLLIDGYNGGTLVSTDIPKKVTEYAVDQSPQIKVEF